MILSKTYDRTDKFDTTILGTVERHWASASPQHEARRWEYAMALEAFRDWRVRQLRPAAHGHFYDVGGAGSPFYLMVPGTFTIDPAVNVDLQTFVGTNALLADAVFCISVIEHVDDLDEFLYHLSCLVAPGGLLFLTTDFQPDEGPDDKHFHWMRKRIFTPFSLGAATGELILRDFTPLGDSADYRWHGPIEPDWGYSFASLALVKRA